MVSFSRAKRRLRPVFARMTALDIPVWKFLWWFNAIQVPEIVLIKVQILNFDVAKLVF